MAEEYLQNLDIYKHDRVDDMKSFNFERNGQIDLIAEEESTEQDLLNLGVDLRPKRLLPSLTLFYGRSSNTYREEIQQFMVYCMKELKKYKEVETQREQNREMFMEAMAALNFDRDLDIQLPNMSQLQTSQILTGTGTYTNHFDQEGFANFDQPIAGGYSAKYEGPLLEELNETLRQGNMATEDLEYRDGFQMTNQQFAYDGDDIGNFEDYGEIESKMKRNPEDYITPTNIFLRAAKRLNTIENNMKMYNMKKDLKNSDFRSHTEYFGPDSIQVKKEKLPKIKRILDGKNSSAMKKVKPPSGIDFNISTETTFDSSFLESLLTVKKKSRVRMAEKEDIDLINQNHILPPEEIFSLDSFNSLFTRNIKEFNLEEELAKLDQQQNIKAEHFEVPYDNEDYDFPAGNMNFNGRPDQSQMGMEAEGGGFIGEGYGGDEGGLGTTGMNPEGISADMTGMNLFHNYFNIKEDDKILSLERKLAQNYNFKITEFKKHVDERYIQLLESTRNVSLGS